MIIMFSQSTENFITTLLWLLKPYVTLSRFVAQTHLVTIVITNGHILRVKRFHNKVKAARQYFIILRYGDNLHFEEQSLF